MKQKRYHLLFRTNKKNMFVEYHNIQVRVVRGLQDC